MGVIIQIDSAEEMLRKRGVEKGGKVQKYINRQSHQAKNQAAVSGGYFGRNRLGTKDPAANSGRWGRIQEAGNQAPPCHGGIGHDFVQHTGLN